MICNYPYMYLNGIPNPVNEQAMSLILQRFFLASICHLRHSERITFHEYCNFNTAY